MKPTALARGAALCTLLLAAAPAAHPVQDEAARPADPAETSVSVRLPDTGLQLELAWRQVGSDLSRYVQPQDSSPRDVHMLRVQALLAFGGKLTTDATLHAGGHRFRAGAHPLGFTVNQSGRPVFYLVDGTEAIELPSTELRPGWTSPRMLLQLVVDARDRARLVWHHGDQAGAIDLRIGPALG